MSSFCVFVKPTARRPNSTFVSLQRSGPVWKGARLRLERPDELGLRFPVLIGWSDFYGGTPAPVAVAWASDGERSGWVAWGGSQGLRAIPESAEAAADAIAASTFEERPLLWIDDARMLPAEVRAVVARDEDRSHQGCEPRPGSAARGSLEGRTAGEARDGAAHPEARSVPLPHH
jgi:hypothetical protein